VHIAILTFDGYNELDSLIALGVLNRVRRSGWRVSIAAPAPWVRSMNGVVIESMASLEEACEADAVVVGSGTQTREVVADPAIMGPLGRLDPSRQLLAGLPRRLDHRPARGRRRGGKRPALRRARR
jgi:transcriptional regulator GlxA family with amidase domain